MRQSVIDYLLAVQRLFPGSGITVHNWRDTPLFWWKQYVAAVDQQITK